MKCRQCPIGTYNDQLGCDAPNGDSAACCKVCPTGHVTNSTGQAACSLCTGATKANAASVLCEPCDKGSVGAGGAVCQPCENGMVADVDGVCKPCPQGVFCAGGIVHFIDDYWVHPDNQSGITNKTNVYQCSTVGVCLGNNTDGMYCREGHESLLCGVCSWGYQTGLIFCERCPGETGQGFGAVITLITCAVVFLILLAVLLIRQAAKTKDDDEMLAELTAERTNSDIALLAVEQGKAAKATGSSVGQGRGIGEVGAMTRAVVLPDESSDVMGNADKANQIGSCCSCLATVKKGMGEKGKIIIAYMQVSQMLTVNINIVVPEELQAMYTAFKAINIDLSALSGLSCQVATTYYDKFYSTMALPVFISLFILCIYQCGNLCCVKSKKGKAWMKNVLLKAWTLLLFLIFPNVCNTLMRGFKCLEINGERWLEADLRLSCGTGFIPDAAHPHFLPTMVGIVCFFLFPIGIPASMIYLMYSNKVWLPLEADEEKKDVHWAALQVMKDGDPTSLHPFLPSREDDEEPQRYRSPEVDEAIGWLFDAYEAKFWYSSSLFIPLSLFALN